jgi:hypothetical protein
MIKPIRSYYRFWHIWLIFLSTIIACRIIGSNWFEKEDSACPPLPSDFEESFLIGTWIAEYFDDTDTLIINPDHTYKQIFNSNSLSFESDWQDWYFEYSPQGYGELHLTGMRRCDDTNRICNTIGGGLPIGERAINPCTSVYITYSDEVVLFITGYSGDVPRGIVLRQARLAGSDWEYGFKLNLEESR